VFRNRLWMIVASLCVAPVVMPDSASAQTLTPIPEEPGASDSVETVVTEQQVCPQFPWMDWGTHKSFYALFHNIEDGMCDAGMPVNYDAPSNTPSPLFCDRCDPIYAIPSERTATAQLIQSRHAHRNIKLPRPIGAIWTSRQYYNQRCQPGYRIRSRHTGYHLVKFDVTTTDDEAATVYVAVRHIRLSWRGPGERGRHWPDSHTFHIGHEVTGDCRVDDRGGDASRFRDVVTIGGQVKRITDNVVHLRLREGTGMGPTYQVITATDIASIP